MFFVCEGDGLLVYDLCGILRMKLSNMCILCGVEFSIIRVMFNVVMVFIIMFIKKCLF